MSKDIVISMDGGEITSVHCPDGDYRIHILETGVDTPLKNPELKKYYKDVELRKGELKDCLN